MQVYKLNEQLMTLELDHPVRRFLDSFVDCRLHCVGRECGLEDGNEIDQKWFSIIDNRPWRFSEFAYSVLSFDVVLDGWIQHCEEYTESEIAVINNMPRLRALMTECASAATVEKNESVLILVEKVRRLLELWETCIRCRLSPEAEVP
jgi:hypothetical protein